MRHWLPIALLIITLPSAHAQTPRSGGESQAIMQQYQQLAAERTSLKSQLEQLQKTLDATKSELSEAKKERDALKARGNSGAAAVAQANNAKQAAEQSLEQLKTRSTELVSRFRETAQNLKQAEAERATLQKQLGERNAAYDKCVTANVSLAKLTDEVLQRYEHVGMFTKATASEPFTKITRARIDNLVDEYRARASELAVKEPGH